MFKDAGLTASYSVALLSPSPRRPPVLFLGDHLPSATVTVSRYPSVAGPGQDFTRGLSADGAVL